MNFAKTITTTIAAAILAYTFILNQPAWANSQSRSTDSKRIEVYSLSQNYWDTKSGETLGEIVQKLLPYNKGMQQQLMQDIMELNPNAFLENNPDHMQANKRLWLPNSMVKADTRVNQKHFSVESFAWGNIKRPRR